jgi:hypothetical protein
LKIGNHYGVLLILSCDILSGFVGSALIKAVFKYGDNFRYTVTLGLIYLSYIVAVSLSVAEYLI